MELFWQTIADYNTMTWPVQALIVLGVSFGLQLSSDQTAAILAVTAVVLGLITRSQVTPV